MTTALPLRPATVINPSVPTPFASRCSRNCGCRGVVTDGADELHVRARARRRHRLIGALAAGCRAHRGRQRRLARPGQCLDIEPDVHIHAAHHANPRHSADVME